jgi:group I intron endonuclease
LEINFSKRFIHNIAGEGKSNLLSSVVPVIKFDNAAIHKSQIVKEIKGKSGVYRWTNLMNGNSYIGSSSNLTKRFQDYYNFSHLTDTKRNMLIYKALVKHSYSNFSFEILEYCDPSSIICREQHYIDLLNPEYNVLKIAGSNLGFKHYEKTMAILKARTLTSEQKAKRL